MKNIITSIYIVSALVLFSCNQDEDIQPNSGGGGIQTPESYLHFQLDGQAFNLEESNGIVSANTIQANNQGAANAGTGLSFKDVAWPITDRVFFQIVLPIDSTGVSNFAYEGVPFIINNNKIGPFMYEFAHTGTILIQWDSADGNLDELREYNEVDNTTFYNSITSIEYVGNHHYDSIENLWKCDFRITGNFEMRLQNENTNEIKVVSNGEYSMIVDVIAQ
jgi:hypothetical protein